MNLTISSSPFPDIRERLSPNRDERAAPGRIDMLVLHYTGMQSGAAAIERLCDPEAKVSSHYVVEEDGVVWRLVPEDKRAWHAGVSYWEGGRELNHVSIGIEIVNPGHEWGYRPFPETQMGAVEALCCDLVARHRIPAHRVVGHSDVAPTRKADPGELFDWPRLARAGIGIWPEPAEDFSTLRGRGVGVVARARALGNLARIGYEVVPGNEQPPLAAFQRRFRPARWDGRLDAETAARLAEVHAAYDAVRHDLARRQRERFNAYRRMN